MEAKKRINESRRKRLIFYILGISLPVIQVIFFYFVVNFNSFLLAFQKFEMFGNNAGKYVFLDKDVIMGNFKDVIDLFVEHKYMRVALYRGLLLNTITIGQMMLSTFISYYIARKYKFGSFFQTVLFLPGIISALVMVLLYKYFVCDCIPEIWKLITGETIPSLLDTGKDDTTFKVMLFYTIYSGIGSNVLIMVSSMTNISHDVIEAGELDGITPFKEFIYIYFPLTWPTISTFILTSFSGIFTASISLYTFYGANARTSLYTFGYYITMRTQTADMSDYPFLAAIGLMMSAVTIPLTLVGRKVLNRIEDKFS